MGKLIVIEGNDGSGKTTQVNIIKDYIESKNLSFKHFHFPAYGDNEFSAVISNFLKGDFGESKKVNPYFVGNIFAMDQFLFLPKLIKALNTYDIVLLDRYVYSNIVYQTAKLEGEEQDEFASWIIEFYNFLDMPIPDLSLYLSVPIDIIKKRLEIKRVGEDRNYLNGETDVHENDIELLKAVHQNYLELFTPDMSSDNRIIVKCTDISGDLGDVHLIDLDPPSVFEVYKKEIDNIL